MSLSVHFSNRFTWHSTEGSENYFSNDSSIEKGKMTIFQRLKRFFQHQSLLSAQLTVNAVINVL
jgi:hypothetical protein